jgi:hypothetical protein
MGDRGNIVVEEDKGKRVCFYAHWSGSELPHLLGKALRRRQRWDDAPYLARIIFCMLIAGQEVDGETGFGISTEPCDNEWPLLVVDVPGQQVLIEDDGRPDFTYCKFKGKRRQWSFEEFAEAFGAEGAGWQKLQEAPSVAKASPRKGRR